MDQIKKAQSRLSLLASASLIVTALSAAPVLFSPTLALAANECGNPAANGTANDTFICSDTTTYTQIDYPATSGNLTLQLRNDVTVTTGGLTVRPTGTNTVSITRTTDSPADSGDPQITSVVGPGILVERTTGGTITVNLSENDFGDSPELSVTGTTAGIYLSNTGTGTTALTTNGGTITATNGYGVRLRTLGTGNITFTNGATVTGTSGSLLVEGLNATVTNGGQLQGDVVFNNTGTVTFNNNGPFSDVVTFNNAGATTVTNLGVWLMSGALNMGAGASTFTNGVQEFFGGQTVAGVIQVDGVVSFTSLEAFNNAGDIVFGDGADGATDGAANDRLILPTDFNVVTGTTPGGFPIFASALVMDFIVGGGDQLDCAAAVTADCLDMRGHSVTGLDGTLIVLNAVDGGGFTAASKIVLVDAGGGSLEAGDFVLSSDNVGYVEGQGGAAGVDTGLLIYTLVTDESADQVYLTAASPNATASSVLQLAGAPQAVWDLGASAVTDRQQELRDRGEEGVSGWLRAVSGSVDNARLADFGGFAFDVGYDQETTGIIGGVDVSGDGWLAGLSAASFNAEVRTAAQTAVHELTGYGLAGYGSWSAGAFFVDGLLNYTSLDVASTLTSEESEGSAMGALGEAGLRLAISDNVSVEPLAALSWVDSDGIDLVLEDATIEAGELSALHAGLGVRLKASAPIGGLTGRFAFTGRAWQPLGDGEAEITVTDGGSSFTSGYEENQDILGDVGLTAGLHGLADRLSLSATARLKFKEDYQDSQFLVGLRYRF